MYPGLGVHLPSMVQGQPSTEQALFIVPQQITGGRTASPMASPLAAHGFSHGCSGSFCGLLRDDGPMFPPRRWAAVGGPHLHLQTVGVIFLAGDPQKDVGVVARRPSGTVASEGASSAMLVRTEGRNMMLRPSSYQAAHSETRVPQSWDSVVEPHAVVVNAGAAGWLLKPTVPDMAWESWQGAEHMQAAAAPSAPALRPQTYTQQGFIFTKAPPPGVGPGPHYVPHRPVPAPGPEKVEAKAPPVKAPPKAPPRCAICGIRHQYEICSNCLRPVCRDKACMVVKCEPCYEDVVVHDVQQEVENELRAHRRGVDKQTQTTTTYTSLKGAAAPRFVVTPYITRLGVWSSDGTLLRTVSTGGIVQGAAAAAPPKR